MSAEIRVQDDIGEQLVLEGPAQRVITLAPHLTELVYAVGGGDQMTATVAWSDFPAAAKALPVIGSNNKINYEALLQYQPDLVLVWLSGNGESMINRLKSLDLNVYVNKPRHLDDIPRSVLNIGKLLGREETAEPVVAQFRQAIKTLGDEYGQSRPVTVYYQIWQSPGLGCDGTVRWAQRVCQYRRAGAKTERGISSGSRSGSHCGGAVHGSRDSV